MTTSSTSSFFDALLQPSDPNPDMFLLYLSTQTFAGEQAHAHCCPMCAACRVCDTKTHVLTAHCPLPTTHYPVPIPHRTLPTTHQSLPTTYYPLPSVHRSPRTNL